MYSRTTSALFTIIVCTSAFWSVKATTTGLPPTEGHAAASESTKNLPSDTSAFPVGETTLSHVLNASPNSTNSTFNNGSTTVVYSTKLSPAMTPAPVKTSPKAGSNTTASTTLNSSVAIPGTVHKSSTVHASTTLPSSVASSKTGRMSSTVTESNTTPTVFPISGTSTSTDNTTQTFPVKQNSTLASDKSGNGMKYSETVLTSIFSTILVVVLLTTLAFCFNKYRKRRSQYSHQPLRENVYESEGYSPPDDTLVISGGLYDAPRIYNPNMTVLEEDDSQHDYVSFSSRPGQFRLEFLPGDKDTDPAYNGSLRRNV